MAKLLIGMTGSMGMLNAPNYLAAISQHYPQLKVILTHSASHFIPKESLSIFTEGIYTHEFPISKDNMMHMELARWADIFIVLPASAHVLSQTAHGNADTLLSSTILAYEKKIIFFPNMNSAMWKNKILQRNVSLIRDNNHIVVEPIEKPAYEYASRQFEIAHVAPSIDSILSFIHLEKELLT